MCATQVAACGTSGDPISKANRNGQSVDDEAEFMPPGIELRGITIYPVGPGLGQFGSSYSSRQHTDSQHAERLAASMSQMASPITKQSRVGILRRSRHAIKRSGSGLVCSTSLLQTTITSSGRLRERSAFSTPIAGGRDAPGNLHFAQAAKKRGRARQRLRHGQ
jgi:hypothetical protein